MIRNHCAVLTLVLLVFFGTSNLEAAESQPLLVGTRESPPFAMKNAAGQWEGLSIDLFRAVAGDLGHAFEFREATIEEMLKQTVDGRLAVAAAALTITAERAETMDFTHPFTSSGLGIGVPDHGSGTDWIAVVMGFFSPAFLKVVLALSGVLLAAGFGVWFFERNRNPDQFGGKSLQGLGNGFWWSAVTMTTVGYGDRAPITLGGRFIALVWMFTSIIIISGFTATLASSLTVQSMGDAIKSASDLPRYRIAALKGSTSEAYLRGVGATTVSFATIQEAVLAVGNGTADAVVHDAPILRYMTKDIAGVRVLPGTFNRQDYGFALPRESSLRQPMNVALLKRINSPWWEETLSRYLGADLGL